MSVPPLDMYWMWSGGDWPGEALLFDRLEGFFRPSEDCRLARVGLPAPHRDVDVGRIDLDRSRLPTGPLGCDQDRAAAAERIEHQAATARTILDRICDQCDRFDRWMHRQLFHAPRTHRVDPGVIPNV